MSWSKPTPRVNESIPASGRASSSDDQRVIPIRGITPATPVTAIRPPDSTDAFPRPRNVPVEARPWRILFVPPTPGAQTRALNLARWQRRTVVGVLIALVVIAGGAVATIVIGLTSPDVFARSADLASLRGRLLAVEDSLSLARAALADAEDLVHGPRAGRSVTSEARRRLLFGGNSVGLATLSSDGLPVIGAITSEFSNARRHPLLKIMRPHLGVDITAARGTRISAPAAGRVSFVGYRFALGLMIEIEHAGGITTRYAHCRLSLVRVGDRVSRGSMIATVGSSGLTTGPHLHYEIWDHGTARNPLRFHLPQLADNAAVPGAAPLSATVDAATAAVKP